MQQFIQTLELRQGCEAAYEAEHRAVWREVVAGIREVGIERMDIFRDGTRLVMILELPDHVDFDQAMARLATLPRQAEWEEHVARYQLCDPSSTSAGKWRRMNQIFTLPE